MRLTMAARGRRNGRRRFTHGTLTRAERGCSRSVVKFATFHSVWWLRLPGWEIEPLPMVIDGAAVDVPGHRRYPGRWAEQQVIGRRRQHERHPHGRRLALREPDQRAHHPSGAVAPVQ